MNSMQIGDALPSQARMRGYALFPMAPLQQVKSYTDGLGWQVSRPFSCKDRDIVAITSAIFRYHLLTRMIHSDNEKL